MRPPSRPINPDGLEMRVKPPFPGHLGFSRLRLHFATAWRCSAASLLQKEGHV